MKTLRLKMSLSADGFCADAKSKLDWLFETESKDATKWDVAACTDASLHLMGSRTFRDMAAWWPTSREPFAPAMNTIPKAVFTQRAFDPAANRKLTTLGLKSAQKAMGHTQGATPSEEVINSWLHPQIFKGKLAASIKQLKHGHGKPLLAHGGAGFARSLIASGLVDEYWLLIHPVILGRGLPIFSEAGGRIDLKLVDSKRFKSGAVAQIYSVK
ncbi:dihydrofolate reductase family protein [Oleiharenicola lentus]|uniref:dihydrofolate reductase family protein n=1 Tax=Oleiharenicola lentus TaxID=2508720 RepID=UPI003F66B14A